MREQVDGRIGFCISFALDAREMATWPAARIERFFGGVALVLRAVHNTLPPPVRLLTYVPNAVVSHENARRSPPG